MQDQGEILLKMLDQERSSQKQAQAQLDSLLSKKQELESLSRKLAYLKSLQETQLSSKLVQQQELVVEKMDLVEATISTDGAARAAEQVSEILHEPQQSANGADFEAKLRLLVQQEQELAQLEKQLASLQKLKAKMQGKQDTLERDQKMNSNDQAELAQALLLVDRELSRAENESSVPVPLKEGEESVDALLNRLAAASVHDSFTGDLMAAVPKVEVHSTTFDSEVHAHVHGAHCHHDHQEVPAAHVHGEHCSHDHQEVPAAHVHGEHCHHDHQEVPVESIEKPIQEMSLEKREEIIEMLENDGAMAETTQSIKTGIQQIMEQMQELAEAEKTATSEMEKSYIGMLFQKLSVQLEELRAAEVKIDRLRGMLAEQKVHALALRKQQESIDLELETKVAQAEEIKQVKELPKSALKKHVDVKKSVTVVDPTPVQETIVDEERVDESEVTPLEIEDPQIKKLFDAHKDDIYKGAASVISSFEHDPYFLLTLFKKLPLLKKPFARQQLMFALDDIVDLVQSESVSTSTVSTASVASQIDHNQMAIHKAIQKDEVQEEIQEETEEELKEDDDTPITFGQFMRVHMQDWISSYLGQLTNQTHFTNEQINDVKMQVKSMIYAHMTSNYYANGDVEGGPSVATATADQAMVLLELLEPSLNALLEKYVGMKFDQDHLDLITGDIFAVFDEVFGWDAEGQEIEEEEMEEDENEVSVVDVAANPVNPVEWKAVRNIAQKEEESGDLFEKKVAAMEEQDKLDALLEKMILANNHVAGTFTDFEASSPSIKRLREQFQIFDESDEEDEEDGQVMLG